MKNVVIIGAGPAGLAAGFRLCEKNIRPLILEQDSQPGGISRTILRNGNYYDLGGHRFFTRHRQVLAWWQQLLEEDFLSTDRFSSIYYRRQFFRYPISIPDVFRKLGPFAALSIAASYSRSRLRRQKAVVSFRDWIVERFGEKLFRMFFKEYTEKVWGMPCEELSADWAGQRIRGLSLGAALRSALSRRSASQIKTLIKQFYFPRFGCGMMYERAAEEIARRGGEIRFNAEVSGIEHDGTKVSAVLFKGCQGHIVERVPVSEVCSSMPITSLVAGMQPSLGGNRLAEACRSLRYRSLIMVFCLFAREKLTRDNWIYVNAPQVKVARIQVFKNWSSQMVADPRCSTLGLEYFCDEGDGLWNARDEELIRLAGRELEDLKLARGAEMIEAFVVRVAKAYPVYDLDYRARLTTLRTALSRLSNLYCIGRNGMFRYNNMDHSALTGFLAAENIVRCGSSSAHDLWLVNLDEEYNG